MGRDRHGEKILTVAPDPLSWKRRMRMRMRRGHGWGIGMHLEGYTALWCSYLYWMFANKTATRLHFAFSMHKNGLFCSNIIHICVTFIAHEDVSLPNMNIVN